MADREEPQPLIPQYSIRWLLAVTAGCGGRVFDHGTGRSRQPLGDGRLDRRRGAGADDGGVRDVVRPGLGVLVDRQPPASRGRRVRRSRRKWRRRNGRPRAVSPRTPSPTTMTRRGSNDRLAASVSPPAVAAVAAMLASPGVLPAQPQPQPATAVTGSAFSVVGSGLRVTVDNRFLDNPGYRPFRITVTPTTPVAADRTLTVELVFRRRRPPGANPPRRSRHRDSGGLGTGRDRDFRPAGRLFRHLRFRRVRGRQGLAVAFPADADGIGSRDHLPAITSSGCRVCWSWARRCPTRRTSP